MLPATKGVEGKESAIVATKFTPLHDRILVRRVAEVGATRGGIIIPDSAKDKPQEGEVISVGKGKTNDEGKVFPLALKDGDRILFGKYSGTEIKIDGEVGNDVGLNLFHEFEPSIRQMVWGHAPSLEFKIGERTTQHENLKEVVSSPAR
jgi:chaperonin GroES